MITLGGNAELELYDSADPFSEGIVFSVMPPKKSWKNISNLSGGEKTLSSLALVFALHTYKVRLSLSCSLRPLKNKDVSSSNPLLNLRHGVPSSSSSHSLHRSTSWTRLTLLSTSGALFPLFSPYSLPADLSFPFFIASQKRLHRRKLHQGANTGSPVHHHLAS
jgi:hypothetical protein